MTLSPETFEGTDITQAIVQVDADPRVMRALRPFLISLMDGTSVTPTVNATATGNSQSTAFLILATYTHFGTVAAGTGAILNASISLIQIFNGGANTLYVYPPIGAQINSFGVNVPAQIAPGTSATFLLVSTGQWSAF